MSKEQILKQQGITIHPGHEYITRRQLLGAGVIPFAGAIVAPTIWDVLLRNGIAEAQTNCTAISAGASPFPAVMQYHLSGGPQSNAITVPMTGNGAVLTGAGKFGLGTNPSTYTAVNAFSNNVPFPTTNGTTDTSATANPIGNFINAVLSAAGTTTASQTTLVCNASDSGNDSGTDVYDISGMMAAWATGLKLPHLAQGGSFAQTTLTGTPSTVNVNSVTSITNLIAPSSGIWASLLTNAQKQNVMNTISSLTPSQGQRLASQAGGSNFASLLSCSGIQNVQLLQQTPPSVDARQVASLQTIYGITTTTSASSSSVVEATIVNSVLQGLTPCGALSLGGYDYHGNGAANAATMDAAAGKHIGQYLAAAAAFKVPAFAVVTYDGSTNTNSQAAAGGAGPQGDFGPQTTLLFAYSPTKVYPVSSNWINYYTTGQAPANGYSSSDLGSSAAAVANIMNAWGSIASFSTIFGSMSGAPSASNLASISATSTMGSGNSPILALQPHG